MNPIEDDLRATFRRHEPAVDTQTLKTKISSAYVRKKRHRTIRRTLTTAALVLAVAAVPIGLNRVAASPHRVDTATAKPAAPSGPLNVLLVTTGDSAHADLAVPGKVWPGLDDTVTLVHVSADRKTVYLIGFPAKARIGATGTTLEDAVRHGGASQASDVLDQLTGISTAGTASLHVSSLAGVPIAAGDVPICLPAPAPGMPGHHGYPKGCQQADLTEISVLVMENSEQITLRVLRALATKLSDGHTLDNPNVIATLRQQLGKGRLTITGRVADLAGVARALNSPKVIAITGPDSAAYPGVGPSLYQAIGRDQLGGWVAANPSYVLGD